MTILGVAIDDHFWPSIYPAIVVGLIYGFNAGRYLTAAAGAFGGMMGAIAAFIAIHRLGLDEGPLTLTALVASSLLGAYLAVAALTLVLPQAALRKPAK